MVIASGTESVIYNYMAFFTYNEEGTRWAYNGEYRYTAGIMQVTQAETPIAYFTTGHSEDIDNAATLASLLTDAGFEVRYMYACVAHADNKALMIFSVNNPEEANKLIEATDSGKINPGEIYRL